jgi:hypothetical protein
MYILSIENTYIKSSFHKKCQKSNATPNENRTQNNEIFFFTKNKKTTMNGKKKFKKRQEKTHLSGGPAVMSPRAGFDGGQPAVFS